MMARAKNAWLAALGGMAATVAMTAAGALGAGCGSETASGASGAKLPDGVKSEVMAHEACDETGRRVETLDANNDGKADVKRVYDQQTGKEVCRVTDLNHDNKPDMYEYYDASGALRRREADYDDSGVIDAVEYFEGGKLARRELDTTGQHRIDTWDYFDTATGKRTKRERDSTNDGRVDQWWSYEGEKVTIALDRNGDGKPDPDNTVVIGGGKENAKYSTSLSDSQMSEDAGVDAAPAAAAAPPPAADVPDAAPPPAPDAGPAAKAATKNGGKK